MICILVIVFSLLFLSCSTSGFSEEKSFTTVKLNLLEDENFTDSSTQVSIKDYGFASFVSPNSKKELDTLTIPLDGFKSDCTVRVESFSCRTVGKNCFVESRSLDTVFINYGSTKLMDFLPYYKIPVFDTSAFKKIFSTVRIGETYALSDTIESSYKLSQKGLPAGIDFYYVTRNAVQDVTDPCAALIEYPHLNMYMYQLQRKETDSLVGDTVVDWTLFYTDQYGQSDSLEMKTMFR